jgi:hypothetical protein
MSEAIRMPTGLAAVGAIAPPAESPAVEMPSGSIHIEKSAQLPVFLDLRSDSLLSGWAVIRNGRASLDEGIRKAGLQFFFMAGNIGTSAFGFDQTKTLRAALNKLVTSVTSRNCNSFEINSVTSKVFLGITRVTVSAHARHLQQGPVCFE